MFASNRRSLRRLVCLAPVLGLAIAFDRGAVTAQSSVFQLKLSPQDTFINTNKTNYSKNAQLMTYTWPDNEVANAILMKFDLSTLPAGASIQQAALQLSLTQSDTSTDAAYTIGAYKIVGRNPSITAATGYNADGTTAWTANKCCSKGVPMAQSDVSAAYDAQAIDKVNGVKTWTITSMVQEWAAAPTKNYGLLLNADTTKQRDRFRYFASMENASANLRPSLTITYTLPVLDTTPPSISAVASSSLTSSAATISWTTDEPADSQVDFGLTSAYGSSTPLNVSLSTAHVALLSALSGASPYHFRVRSRDAAGNAAVSGDFTFTTIDGTAPSVSIASPAANANVSGTVQVTASAGDNVGVAGVQFKLDGANLGSEAASAPYSVSWNTTGTGDGSHSLTAVARDAAGNTSTAAAVAVTVSNNPPVVSAVASSAVSASGATITWTTDKPSSSMVAYGATTAYGTATPLDPSMVLTHAAALSGLKDGTLYHFRVQSSDAAGNVGVSGDFTVTTVDATAPTVSLTAPAANASLSGVVTISANASDNVGVAGVQFRVDGVNVGAEAAAAPYSASWDTTTTADGTHTVTAVARDAAGNIATSASVAVAVANNVVRLVPQDTFINLDATNYSTSTQLITYTWPDNEVANAILMKFDLSGIPPGAVVQNATLNLALLSSDTTTDATYTISANKLTGRNPVISAATGSTSDGTTAWTASACCYNSYPLAQADISTAYDTQAVDKTPGYKRWTMTSMVQEWINNPSTNFGVMLDSDTSKLRDRFRSFASTKNADATLQPYLLVSYVPGVADTTAPTVAIGAPAANATVSGTVSVSANASDNVGVVGVQFKLDGANLGAEALTAPYSAAWITSTASNGAHTLTAVARDASGNTTTSSAVAVTVSNDTIAPLISAISVSSITTSSAAIAWTTNEAADSQVEYGATTAYGSMSALNANGVTAHNVALSGLSAATTYHFRVRSRDAAGNLALSGDATFATASAPTSPWPHQPTGFSALTDWAMNALSGSGWFVSQNPNGYATITQDAAAPVSPSNVGQWMYPSGFGGGYEPATIAHSLPSGFNEGFVGVSWKPSNPWQGHSTYVNKIFFVFGGACGNLIPIMYGPPGGPYHLRVAPEWGNWSFLVPNVNDVPVALGAWHNIELYFKYNNGGANGIVRWWMDGTLIGDYTNISFPASGCFAELQLAPTWGGVGDVKTETDYFWFDHVLASQPSGSQTSDTTPPTVSIQTPVTGAALSGSTLVTVNAADNVGVAGVQFKLDGANLGGEDLVSPFSLNWDTTTTTNGSHTLTAVARDAAGNTATAAAIAVTVSNAAPPPTPGTILFQETFEDGNFAARGWYDNANPVLTTAEHVSGSTHSAVYTWSAGATVPAGGAAMRRTFTPTDSVYLGYWVKYSANYVGSGKPYHPHEFHFLTTLDGAWSGLSFDHLTTYIEQNAGTPVMGIQDGSNVDQSKIGVNLVGVTENRGVAGCNGSSDGYPDNCYSNGTQYVNEKKWWASQQYFTNSAGPNYKNDWHFVEAFVKMNSISGGKGMKDGVVQYWFDGQLIIDHRDVLLRTGANAAMQFNQFIIAPYIGDGSPVAQSFWIDNLTVATGKP